MTSDERIRPGDQIQTFYCSDCRCEHTASVIGGVVVPERESPPLRSLKEVESEMAENGGNVSLPAPLVAGGN